MVDLMVADQLEEGKIKDFAKKHAGKIALVGALAAGGTAALHSGGPDASDKAQSQQSKGYDSTKKGTTVQSDMGSEHKGETRSDYWKRRKQGLRDKANKYIPAGKTKGKIPPIAPHLQSGEKSKIRVRPVIKSKRYDPTKKGPTGQGKAPWDN